MKRPCVFFLLISFALMSVSGRALAGTDAAVPGALQRPVTGTYFLVVNLPGAAEVPGGETRVCRAWISPSLHNDGPGVIVTAPARRIGPSTACTIPVPFAWKGGDARPGAEIRLEIDAVTSSGELVRHILQQGIAVDDPPPGGTAQVNVSVDH